MTERLPELVAGRVYANDRGSVVTMYACDNYGEDPETMDSAEVRELRDWLTAWLERQ
jgi:hypothetical protein